MARRLSLTLGLLAAVLVAGAAATMAAAGSSSNGRKGPRTFPAPVPRHLRRPGIRGPQDAPTLLWSQATAVGQMSAAPTLDGQFAFIQTGPNILSFFQQEGWITKVYNSTAPANGQGYSSPIINNGTVYFGAENNLFFAYDQKTGARVWEFPTQGPIMSSAAFENGILYFGDTLGNYYAVSAADGTQLWCRNDCTASQPTLSNGVFHQHIVIDGSNLYFGSSFSVCSVAKSDGTLQWSYQTGDTVGSTVVVTDQYVYAGSNDKCLYQLTLSGGNLVNSFCATSSPINSSPILKDGTIYYADDFGTVTALNADSLNLVWSMNYFQPTQGALLIVDDVLLAPNHAGVIGMDTVTGDTLWWWLDPQAAVIGGLAYNPQSNVIFFGDRIGTAYGLQLSSSSSSTRVVV